MAIKEAQAQVTPEVTPCRQCGHPHTRVAAPSSPEGRLWLAYCPACHHVQEYAAIPDWFLDGLPVPQRRRDLH